ncbi:MAG: YtcA family lipoprotein [Phycisphaerales bacterium]|nr:YtcA family lipoprotein [Phycisphaerales bacterium]
MMQKPLLACLLPPCLLMAGCDPLINIEGAYFPSWLVSGIGGVIGTVVLHAILLKMGIDEHLWPRTLVYFATFVMMTFTIWLVLYAS